jgi:invasion protein IalB
VHKLSRFCAKGTRLKVAVVAYGGKETQLAISLKGVSGALDRTIALLN